MCIFILYLFVWAFHPWSMIARCARNNLDVVTFDPHLHHTGFSTASGQTRTVADLLSYWSNRSSPSTITAHIIEKKSKGPRLVGHNAQKISFISTCIRNFASFRMFIFPSQRAQSSSRQSDCLPFPFPPTIALPCLRIDGRSPYIKLAETSYINRRTRLAHRIRIPRQKLLFLANLTPSKAL